MGALRISIIVLIILFALAGCNSGETPQAIVEESEPKTEKEPEAALEKTAKPLNTDEIMVTRAEVAKMLALTFLSPDEIDEMEQRIEFSDVAKTDWHYKYINAAAGLGYMLGGKGQFRPEAPLSIYEAQLLIDRVNPGNKTQIKITPKTKEYPISSALWQQLYMSALAEAAGDKTPEQKYGLVREELTVLATPANAPVLPEWSMVTDKGAYFLRGFNMDDYMDTKISVYAKKKEVMAVSEAGGGEALLGSAYITGAENGYINVFSGGAKRLYKLAGGAMETLPAIADVRISGGTAEIVSAPNDKITGEIKRITDKYIELADGKISSQKNVPAYILTGGEPVYKGNSGLITGTTAEFYLSGGRVCAAVAERPKPVKMRVLITSSDYKMAVHTSVQISATSDFTVVSDEGERKLEKGSVITFDKENNTGLFSSERLYITPNDENGLIEIQSVKRNGESPKYRGTIEISKEGEAFIIVNELDFEKYLYSVVSSQIPEALGGTAVSAQVIAARSAAYNQFYENRLAYYGANVDDSVKFQLYNAAPETEMSKRAVEETAGKVLTYQGDIIKPAFFLASAGYTANKGEVFAKAGGTKFPSDTPGYLEAAKQFEGDFGDLSQEENAAAFFKNTEIDALEKDVSWFRWNVRMDKATVEASINANAGGEGIGQLINMEVLKRGEGGNIMELKITGTSGEFVFKTEYAIRTLIRPYQYAGEGPPVILNRSDGTGVENYQLMPSAFYTFDIERGENEEIISINFYGGGNGHGAGMSQCGAKALADGGASPEKILKHYFTGCDIENKG